MSVYTVHRHSAARRGVCIIYDLQDWTCTDRSARFESSARRILSLCVQWHPAADGDDGCGGQRRVSYNDGSDNLGGCMVLRSGDRGRKVWLWRNQW